MATVNSPINARVVKQLLYHVPKTVPEERHLQAVIDFLISEHFARIPYQDISGRIYALLKDQVVRGAFPDPAKAEQTLSGFFYDITHIATYAPYCDAFFMDKVMGTFARDRRLDLERRYGVRVFSLANWEDFIAWLDEIEASMEDEHRQALKLAYPYLV